MLGTLCLMMIVYVVGTGDQLYPPQLAYPAQAAFPGRVHHSHCQGQCECVCVCLYLCLFLLPTEIYHTK